MAFSSVSEIYIKKSNPCNTDTLKDRLNCSIYAFRSLELGVFPLRNWPLSMRSSIVLEVCHVFSWGLQKHLINALSCESFCQSCVSLVSSTARPIYIYIYIYISHLSHESSFESLIMKNKRLRNFQFIPSVQSTLKRKKKEI